jgi:phenylacetic acid degradation operon negative regulatory protein
MDLPYIYGTQFVYTMYRLPFPGGNMGDSPAADWIGHQMQRGPLRARSLLVTIFGDSIAPHGGSVWLGSLINLVEPFAINERLLRTTIFRLAGEDWIAARREGRRSLYALTEAGARRVAHGERRIYREPERAWGGSWVLVLAGHTQLSARERAELQRELRWEGFSMLAPGLYGHPAADPDTLKEILAGQHLEERVLQLTARGINQDGRAAVMALISHAWPIESLAQRYVEFATTYQALGAFAQQASPLEAFMLRTLLIHAYRRVLVFDPQLPTELLPGDWPGHDAYLLCARLYQDLARRAEEHLVAMLERHSGTAPRAAGYFYQRFASVASERA